MQHSSLVIFCDECGLANDPSATSCAACQHPLAGEESTLTTSASPIAPVKIVPPLVTEVTPGALFAPNTQSAISDCQPGTMLAGRYKIRKEIGRGGFSVVYLARDTRGSPRKVAIKRIQLSALHSRQVIEATETFNREITMLARFKDTKGVPRFYEHLTDPENWYLVMEYVEGWTLEDYLQKRHGYLSEGETIEIGLGITKIMQELHKDSPPVIFRDLKPANIMITPRRELYLIDFGVARNFSFGKKKDTTPLGSPGYAPPEQYGRAQTDQRSDVYSLGATLQTLVTGRDPLELRAGESARNPKPPSPDLKSVLDKMLAPEPTQRPLNMAHAQQLLERIQGPPNFWYSYRYGLVLGAIIGIICVAWTLTNGCAGFFWFYPAMWLFGWARKKIPMMSSSTRKPAWQAALLGAATILLPCALFILWRALGGSF